MGVYEIGQPRKRLAGQLVWTVLWIGVTVVGLFLHADSRHHATHTQLGLPPCPSAFMFQRPCPGCGLTTSWTALLHGQWQSSFSAHPLGPFLYLAFTATALLSLYGYFRGARLRTETPLANRLVLATLAVFMAFGLVRFILVKYNESEFSFRDLKAFSSRSQEGGKPSSVPEKNLSKQFAISGQIQKTGEGLGRIDGIQ